MDMNFAVGDECAFRMETNGNLPVKDRKALCSFNKPDEAASLYNIFHECFNKGKPYTFPVAE